MDIVDNRKKTNTCCFMALTPGTAFFDEDGDLCIKADGVKCGDRLYNAVYLFGGALLSFGPEDEVTPANAKIVIEN